MQVHLNALALPIVESLCSLRRQPPSELAQASALVLKEDDVERLVDVYRLVLALYW